MRGMTVAGLRVSLLATGLFWGGLIVPAAASAPPLAVLAALDKGQWEVHFRDGSSARKLCVATGYELVQLKHPGSGCNRFIVEDAPKTATVQYTCRGNGYGRTTVRRETASLVQLESQGIANGMPFDVSGEARKVGTCG